MAQRSGFGLKRWARGTDTWQGVGTAEPRFDTSTALHKGARDYQQDALLADFPAGSNLGIGLLADGMGGHAGGEVASALAIGTAYLQIKSRLAHANVQGAQIQKVLRSVPELANRAIAEKVIETPETKGMGSTLVAFVVLNAHIYWVSVGDSPLYVFRDGELRRLNEDHSMASQIDAMAETGMISPDLAAKHPQRSVLRSAICGDKIAQVDCPLEPFRLEVDDILILASDGLQTLSDQAICDIVDGKRRRGSHEVTRSLMEAVLGNKDDQQDNISIATIKVLETGVASGEPFMKEARENHPPNDSGDPSVEHASDLLNKALRL